MEGIWEKVWKESSFCIFDTFNIRDQTKCASVSNTSYHCIKTDRCKLFHEWFCSDPVIPQKHHCLFAAFMCDVNHLFCKLCNFPALECLEILVFFAWYTILVIMITLINDKFRTEFITDLSLKLL